MRCIYPSIANVPALRITTIQPERRCILSQRKNSLVVSIQKVDSYSITLFCLWAVGEVRCRRRPYITPRILLVCPFSLRLRIAWYFLPNWRMGIQTLKGIVKTGISSSTNSSEDPCPWHPLLSHRSNLINLWTTDIEDETDFPNGYIVIGVSNLNAKVNS